MVIKRRSTRQNSNVFHMLTKTQIVQLREAFNLLDINADSKLCVDDLAGFLESIGSPFSSDEIAEMIQELEPNPTFMMLLTCIGEKLGEISPEAELCEAFRIFDEDNDGLIDAGLLARWMTESGDRLSAADFAYLIRGCEDGGKVDYRKLVSKIKHGEIIKEGVETGV
ncbi:myosin regulatory light chain 12 [Pancytospora philotis]|nr:myosin regulatory light chain 12 [Pancytospora philotis]